MELTNLSDKQIESFQQSTARINIYEGPVRAGKSFMALLKWLDFCKNGPEGPLIVCGRTDKTIKRNIILPLQEMVGNALVYCVGKGEITLYNRIMYVVGANDDRAEAKIRGSEFAGALLDEVSLLPETFFKMLLSRLSIEGAKLFCSTNPDSPYHWFKTDFINRAEELNCKVFSYTIRDNPTLSEQYIKDLSAEYQGLWYKRYILGEWVLADGAVYDFFDEGIHIIEAPPSQASYYILGIDYGTTNPCVFTLIGYNAGSYPNMWLEKEYYYDSKAELRQKSDYEYSLDLTEFIRGYNVKRIYIDPSAASLKQELKRNGIHNVTDAENDVLPGIRYVGQLLTNGTFKVCVNCVETIKEFANYLWDTKASEKGEDRPIKKFDHCFDGDTLVNTINGSTPIKDINKGDYVLTPIGYKKVLEVFVHEDYVQEYNFFGIKIKCTEDHKFYTANRGWVKARDMLYSDIILVHTENEKWKKKQSFLTESNIQDTYAPKIKILENIIEHLSQTGLKDMTLCTETFGNSTMEKFLPNVIFIIKTGIHSTMKLVTLNSSLPLNTQESMRQCLLTNKEKIKKITQKESLNASNVQKNSLQESKQTQGFVAINVKVSGEEIITLMMSLEYANFVINNSQLINTQKQPVVQNPVEENCIGKPIQSHQNTQYLNAKTATKNLKNSMQPRESFALPRVLLNSGKKQKVYSLHIEDFHGFYVHNILTLNCLDGLRYALFTHFFKKNLRPEFTAADADELERLYSIKYN